MFEKKKNKPIGHFPNGRPIYQIIKNAGGCVCSNNVLNGAGRIKWCVREESKRPQDNGWVFLSDKDTDDFLSDAANMTVVDFNTVANLEPAIVKILDLPVGSDLQIAGEGNHVSFIDNHSGNTIIP